MLFVTIGSLLVLLGFETCEESFGISSFRSRHPATPKISINYMLVGSRNLWFIGGDINRRQAMPTAKFRRALGTGFMQ